MTNSEPSDSEKEAEDKGVSNTKIINSKREKERYARKENPKQTRVWLMTQVRIVKEHQVT